MMEDNDEVGKQRLEIGITALQRFGRRGTVIADLLAKEQPELDHDAFIKEVERRLKTAPPELFE